MKQGSKIILIIQAIIMYIIQIPFIILLILLKWADDIETEVLKSLLIAGLLLNLIMIPVLITSAVFALFNLKKDSSLLTKDTLIVKCALIPWYFINFLVCFLSIAGLINPFLVLTIPVIVAIEVGVTFIYMASTSIHLTVYVIGKIIRKELVLDKMTVFALILLYIFCLDIVGTIIIGKKIKKQIQ